MPKFTVCAAVLLPLLCASARALPLPSSAPAAVELSSATGHGSYHIGVPAPRSGQAQAVVPQALSSGKAAQDRSYDNAASADAATGGAAGVLSGAGAPAKGAASGAAAGGLSKPPRSGIDLAAIDAAVSPCQDFFKYSCGNWLKNNPIPGDQTDWGRFSELHERNQKILESILDAVSSAKAKRDADDRKIGDLYHSCMDQKRIDRQGARPLKPDLARLDALASKRGLAADVAFLHKRGVGAVFSFGSEQDYQDATMAIGAIDQGGLSLPDRDYYLKPQYASDLKAYRRHVARMFELSGDGRYTAAAEAARVVEVETALARISLDRVSQRDPNNVHHKMALAAFEAMAPGFAWKAYFSGLGAPKMAQIDVNSMKFFSRFQAVLAGTSLASWKSYLRWQVIHSKAPMLSKPFVDENFSFFAKRLAGQKQQRPRWKRCVGLVDGTMGEALGRDYVARAFDAHAKAATLKMVGEIESAMKADIQGVAWMSPQTQKKALAKLALVANKIGYPDKWRDYSKLRIARGDVQGNLDRAAEFDSARDLAKIGKKANRQEWDMTPPTVNAYYDPSNNDINFPAGILQPPFYTQGADSAANFGAIGAVVGHELTHGFDDQGRLYDGQGNLDDWWTAKDQKAFEARAQALANEYSSFVVAKDPKDPKKDVRVNGELTLGENTADNGGVRLAYAAFLKQQAKHPSGMLDGYTPAQRFFLGFGQIWCENQTPQAAKLQVLTDPHSPPRFRVDGTLSNMSAFAQAFSCKSGDAMVSKSPVRVW